MSDPIVSHGRGGTGNIGPDTTKYADGEITLEGAQASTVNGPTSTGRGGQGNIGTPDIVPVDHAKEVVPETAVRASQDHENYHVGRGGEGNIHHADDPKDSFAHEGLADKLKRKLFRSKKTAGKKEISSPKAVTKQPATTARGVPPINKDANPATAGGTPASE